MELLLCSKAGASEGRWVFECVAESGSSTQEL